MSESLWSPATAAKCGFLPEGHNSAPSYQALQSLLVLGGMSPAQSAFSDVTCPSLKTESAITKASIADVRADPPRLNIMARATHLLDNELERALAGGKRPLLLFSGGVDSSLMAARLVELGHRDVELLHYQFRDDDAETVVAHQVAAQLGLSLTLVKRDASVETNCLEAPGQIFPTPFGDQSAAPTFELCEAVARVADPLDVVVFDGTGADGAFGLGSKVLSLRKAGRRIPSPVLGSASRAYGRSLWRMNGRPEYLGRIARRMRWMSPQCAAIAQNSLFGVLYDAPDLKAIDHTWSEAMGAFGASALAERVVATDMAITCAAVFAQKTYGPLRSAGFEVSYPFLSADLASLGVAHTSAYPEAEAKGWMKSQLSRQIDRSLIYRPKSGFIDPARRLFDSPGFRDALGGALASDGVARPLVRIKPVEAMLKRTESLSGLPVGHLNLLWLLAFVDRWYRTVTSQSGDPE